MTDQKVIDALAKLTMLRDRVVNGEIIKRSLPVTRNILVGDRRSPMRLEAEFCDMLDEICEREGLRLDDVTRSIVTDGNRTSAVRVFIANYFRAAATEDGHTSAGHRNFRSKPLWG